MANPLEGQKNPAGSRDPQDQSAEPTEIPLNASLTERIGAQATAEYSRFLLELAALCGGLTPDEAIDRLEQKQDELGIRQPAVVNDKLVELLRAAGTNIVVTIDQQPVMSHPGVDYTPRFSDPTEHPS
ncbi:hypothetical protein HJ588_17470 [Flexivirga sp. ID2601S]|uniref:Uncharacterized protein n=1 Tax=Flexivirga aerilata TaxID=1656889 RepID=A0A849ANR2_9MICO|nr:hypothetical protein [Flexivirga aerilata]NNG41051.1 hypothetical protein [Flexivirga aerilata]